MKKIYLNFSIAVISAVLIASCKGKEDEEKVVAVVSQEQAVSTINTSAERTYTDIVDLTSSEGVETLKSVNNLMSGSTGNPFRLSDETKKEKLIAKIKEFRNFFLPSQKTISFGRKANDKFRFNENKGTYIWNKSTESWDKQPGSETATTIVMQFPSDSVKTTNDAQLTINNFSDIAITKDGTIEYMPTAISASLTVNSVKQVGLELTASYNTNNGNPTALNAVFFVKPFTLSTVFAISGSMVSLTTSITKEGEATPVMSEGVSVVMGDIDNMENPKKITNAFVQFRNLKLVGSIEFENFENDTISSFSERFNKHARASLHEFPTENILGSISMIESVDQDMTKRNDLYITFTNGNKELVETYFEKHLEKITDFMKNDLSMK